MIKPINSIPLSNVSLSLSSISLPTHFLPTISSSPPNKVKIPSQISSFSHISLTSSHSSPKQPFFNSTISSNPLHSPLPLVPRCPSDPSSSPTLHRASIIWFCNDLRVHDNESLTSSNNESVSVLPVFWFDPRDYGKSSSGFDKTGPYRALFLVESVSDLRKNLQSRESDLVVRIGKPETVLAELVKAIEGDAVYVYKEVSNDEVKAGKEIEAAMKEEMSTNYGGFKEKVQSLEVRKTIAALDQLRGLPARGDVDARDIPSLVDLGLNPSASLSQDEKPAANTLLVGGETEALQRLTKFASECRAQPNTKGNDSIYGANFSCKISPWLAMGCLSPHMMFDELKKSVSGYGILM